MCLLKRGKPNITWPARELALSAIGTHNISTFRIAKACAGACSVGDWHEFKLRTFRFPPYRVVIACAGVYSVGDWRVRDFWEVVFDRLGKVASPKVLR